MSRFAPAFLFLVVFSVVSQAETPSANPSPSPTPSVAAEEAGPVTKHHYFTAGFYLQGGLPGTFTPAGSSGVASGIGAGYGFTFAFSPVSYVALQAVLDGLFHSVDIPSTADDEFASEAMLGLNLKVYPLGLSNPRLYAMVGIGLVNFWVHDHFTFTPASGEGASFRGPRYNFGLGYELPLIQKEAAAFSLYAEFTLAHTVLDRQTFASAPSVDLSPSVSRWSPILAVGAIVGF